MAGLRYTRLPNMVAIYKAVDELFEAKCSFELRPNANGMYGSIWYGIDDSRAREIIERIEEEFDNRPNIVYTLWEGRQHYAMRLWRYLLSFMRTCTG